MGPWTDYQWRIFGNGNRSVPDMSFNADPASGVWVYDTDEGGGWYVVGGTSVSSPALAGIVNASNNRLGMTPPGGGYYKPYELDLIYAQLLSNTAYNLNFYDVKTGSNGHAAGVGYDQCTGVGSPRGHLGK
jgi:subtilase family serine protease